MADLTPKQTQEIIKQKIITAICSDAIKNVISELHRQAIQTEVYDSYDPTQHNRRYNNNGLMDDDNFDWDIKLDDNMVTLLMKNITKPINSNLSSDDLMNIIESGVGYDWENSNIYKSMPYPRPFIQRTRELIEENRELFIELLRKELIRNGLNIE